MNVKSTKKTKLGSEGALAKRRLNLKSDAPKRLTGLAFLTDTDDFEINFGDRRLRFQSR